MATAKLLEIASATDPRKAIMKAIGDMSKVELFSGRVLLGIYIAPEKTAGGIIRPNANVKEDVYQGQVGLVLKKGAMAFKDDETNKFHGQDVQVGDWVAYRPGDGKRIQINGVDCRIVEDVLLDMVIDDPAIITHMK
jgi:co-chaperonin GroES (HSP10)